MGEVYWQALTRDVPFAEYGKDPVIADAVDDLNGFSDIQAKTGFGDKKIRNIIFRLNKIGKIKRKSRGIYIAAK